MKLLKSPLAITFAVSLLLLVGVGSWLLTDPATSRSEALKTGGLAGGAVVALYALWLNDRRRRVEERRQEIERQRHELEMRRTEQDRERISDERFAKAIELMGNDADQVRVGAMHALAGVARSRTDYTQTVLDVLCSYLHRPFTHPQQGPDNEGNAELERELQVRLTAQRLIVGLLPKAGHAEAPSYDLDLTGAVLEYFDLRGHKVGDLLLRYAKLCNSTNLSDCEITGRAYFTAAATETGRLSGRFYCQRTKFHERAWFSGTEFQADADFEGTTFDGEANFKGAVFHGDFSMKDAEFGDSLNLRQTQFDGHTDLAFASPPKSVDLYNTLVDAERTHELPDGWQIETLRDGRSRLTLPT
jgi:hypothetical protein